MRNTRAPSRSSRAQTTLPNAPDAPVTAMVDMRPGCSQRTAGNARAPPESRAALRGAALQHLALRGHVPVGEAHAGGNPRADARADAIRGRVGPARAPAAPAAAAGRAHSAAVRMAQAAAAQLLRGADEPGLLSLRPAALDRRARRPALHADAAVRAAAGAR